MSRTSEIQSGDMLVTTNGNFMIIMMECCGGKTEEFLGWCAIFVDEDGAYPLEIQYIVSDDNLDLLIEHIEEDGEIIKVVKSEVSLIEA